MDDALKAKEFRKLDQMIGYCHAESCLQAYILRYFGEKNPAPCHHCGNCLDTREKADVTVTAQKVLSCVKRMRERYGKTMVAKVLTGASDQKLTRFRLDRLPTYGLMKEQTQRQISDFIDYLTGEQYLALRGGAYPTLCLTPRAVPVLKGERKVYKKARVRAEQLVVDDALFDQLKQVRKRLAGREYVPPYIIFSDQSLREMSARLPATDHEFLMIRGVGQQKLEKYGRIFMEAIADFEAKTATPAKKGI
jgi:ATP-dependent DNA helicase RecQ